MDTGVYCTSQKVRDLEQFIFTPECTSPNNLDSRVDTLVVEFE